MDASTQHRRLTPQPAEAVLTPGQLAGAVLRAAQRLGAGAGALVAAVVEIAAAVSDMRGAGEVLESPLPRGRRHSR